MGTRHTANANKTTATHGESPTAVPHLATNQSYINRHYSSRSSHGGNNTAEHCETTNDVLCIHSIQTKTIKKQNPQIEFKELQMCTHSGIQLSFNSRPRRWPPIARRRTGWKKQN